MRHSISRSLLADQAATYVSFPKATEGRIKPQQEEVLDKILLKLPPEDVSLFFLLLRILFLSWKTRSCQIIPSFHRENAVPCRTLA